MMQIVGLTGSIAVGKSEVADHLRALGLPVFDADAEVHAFYESAEGIKSIGTLFPGAVTNGCIDRTALGKIVLPDRNRITALEQLVHREIASRRSAFLAKAKSRGATIAIVDVPLLFETGINHEVDKTIVITAPETRQRKWAMARPGMTEEKLKLILARQMPQDHKKKLADFVIDNTGSLEDLQAATNNVLQVIMATKADENA
jgi:dephospho-CoA kinase